MARSKKETIEVLKSLIADVRRIGGDRPAAALSSVLADLQAGKWYDITEAVVSSMRWDYLRPEDVEVIFHRQLAEDLEKLSGALDFEDEAEHELEIAEVRVDIEYYDLIGEQERYWARLKPVSPREWPIRGEPRSRHE